MRPPCFAVGLILIHSERAVFAGIAHKVAIAVDLRRVEFQRAVVICIIYSVPIGVARLALRDWTPCRPIQLRPRREALMWGGLGEWEASSARSATMHDIAQRLRSSHQPQSAPKTFDFCLKYGMNTLIVEGYLG